MDVQKKIEIVKEKPEHAGFDLYDYVPHLHMYKKHPAPQYQKYVRPSPKMGGELAYDRVEEHATDLVGEGHDIIRECWVANTVGKKLRVKDWIISVSK